MPQDPIPQYNLGKLLTLGEKLDEGALHYEQALKLDPGNPQIHTGLADNLLRKGKLKAAASENEAALADFRAAEVEARKALGIDPDLPYGHLNLGVSLREQYGILGSSHRELLDRAVGEYERVLANRRASGANPKDEVHGKALADLCDVLILAGDPRRALEICRNAADAVPGDPLSHYNLAGVYALLGRRDEALGALERDFDLGDRDFQYLSSDRWFGALRGDPRFVALIRKMREATPPAKP
jgi:tetratricopeptide (TPR) repeat protein